ncbi:MAG: hypothetical protein K2V38_01445, partial [Gemmataceae bacterium]|nr:hypothetical protein [Gemmataceae bacterium]
MKTARTLTVETLEAREVPALFGTPWANPGALTLSFAPDGTTVSGDGQAALGQGQTSQMFSKLGGAGTTTQWQTEILRAFQTWAVNANINIGLVPDAGLAFGALGATSDNRLAGDFRIGAATLGSDVLAINQPYSVIGGSWCGDVILNASYNLNVTGGQNNSFRVLTALLNEAGNVFGLPDDPTDPTSARFSAYVEGRTGLSASDVQAIQTLYGGPRARDAFEGAAGNDTAATATRLTPAVSPASPANQMVSAIGADLTTRTDSDWYVFTTAANTTSLTARVETVGKSLLAARVSVFDAAGNLVGTAVSAGPASMQDRVLTVNGLVG